MNNNYDTLMSEVASKSEILIEKFIQQVMDETGLSRECSIKYIEKYCTITYELKEGNLLAKMDFKTIGELFEESISFPKECEKQLLKHGKEQGLL